MKLYLDNIPMGDVPGPRHQPGEFFPRLVGIEVSRDGNDWAMLQPLYIPLVRIQRRAGQILIEVNSDKPELYITLQARRPFISWFRFRWSDQDVDW